MIALRLIGIEWLKARHRVVFWVTTGFFATLFLLFLGITQYRFTAGLEREAFSLPRGWMPLLRGPAALAVLLVTVTVILLVASEHTWRTQRQNVIDGLSRAQFFTGKLLLALLLVVIFWLTPVILAMVFALFDGAPGITDGTGPLLPRDVLFVLGGFFLHLLATAALAVMFGMISSSSGAALALMFVFTVAQSAIFMLLAEQSAFWMQVARRAPFMVFDQLTNPVIYDAARRAEMNERMGNDMPALLSGTEASLWAIGYSILFIGIAWLSFRHRDL